MKRNLVFLGPPGSGKGTQAAMLARRLGIAHLSTGDMLRNAVSEESELGRQAESYMKRGELVPDHLIIGLIERTIVSGKLRHGFILDGFPRTLPQAESLGDMLSGKGVSLDGAVLFRISDEEVVNRLSGRWSCPKCQATYNYPSNVPRRQGICDHDGMTLRRRPDDEETVVRNRLDVYRSQTKPIEDYYRRESLLTEVRAEGTPEQVFQALLAEVGWVEAAS
ncbi:MAG TPA: adenylate kinase [Candidatus Deferrimicrobium sp.]|nr:adenylate kinase [Candidatus Deferrimicrobium sp.]